MKKENGLFRECVSVVLLVAAIACFAGCGKEEKTGPPPAAEVTVISVATKSVPFILEFVAQAESSHQVEVFTRVNGFLEKIQYKEGETVKEGEVMFLIDPKPFLAQVAATKGEVENREAQLWTAKANLDRIKPLAEQDAASKSDLDNAIGSVKSAEASLYEAKARLEKAELDLGYTTIRSPVTGLSSRSLMHEGAYLSASGTTARLTYVARLDPIWINFSVSQNQLAKMQHEAEKGQLILPKDLQYDVEIELSDGARFPQAGKLSFVDPSFSKETGTFFARAVLPNPKARLRPGMFVKAFVKGGLRPNAVVIPQKAVQQTANGHVIYVVNDKGKAELRPVIVGEWIGADWIINQGLKAGDRVIVEGFQRLAPGSPVKVLESEASSQGKTAEQKKSPDASTEKSAAGQARPAGK